MCRGLLLQAALSAATAFAAEFYVSVNGHADGTGGIDQPWDLQTALKHPAALRPGDTLYLRGGIYQAPDRLLLRSRISGSPGAYITVRPFRREAVRIDGGLEIHGPWTVYRDFEVANSRTQRITRESGPFPTDIVQPAGITVYANNVKIVNNTVHDTSTGLASWKDASDNEFYGNIVYNNGWMGADRAHGHGGYMQNRDGAKVLVDNVIFNQFELGLQIYGTSNTFLNNFYLEGNVLFNNGALGGRYSRNILLGGTIRAQNPTLISNYTWYPVDTDHGGDNNIGYYPMGEGCSDLKMENNYFVSGSLALTMFNCSILSFTGNTFIGGTRAFSPSALSGNNYSRPADRPGNNRIFVRPNRWEPGRAHVVVYNWERRQSVNVSLGDIGLRTGELFEVRDMQNLGGRPVYAGPWKGEPVVLPMNGMAVAAPVGVVPFPPRHTDIEFGVFFVRRVPARERTEADAVHQRLLEAEQGVMSGGLAVTQGEGASAGLAVSAGGEGSAELAVDIPSEDNYTVWMRIRSAGAPRVAYTIAVDDAPAEEMQLALDPGLKAWQWVRVDVGTPDSRLEPHVVHLAPGTHKVVIRSGDRDVMLDAVALTNDIESSDAPVLPAEVVAPVAFRRVPGVNSRTVC
ncbi:MAG TPA: right-handed parallel beta-helix repeat-containing protein [Bryobacteraceae bacterium]|nr:right-handed parallel beta-helix repeat-containing protein [Bryobacteraceae bacterium]